MEFWNRSELQTSTQIVVNTGTLTAENIINRDPVRQWISDGFNNDSTIATLRITFDEAVSLSRLALDGINWKKFSIYYNNVTANALAMTSTANTTSSSWITNSQSAMALVFTTITGVTSLNIDIYSTQVANSEKAVGWVLPTSHLLTFAKIPDAGSYDPTVNVEQKEHKLSDGGIRIHTVEKKFGAVIKLKWISSTFKDQLFNVWDDAQDFVFCPFPTSTSWDKTAYEVVWPGKFDFLEYADNNADAGFKGTITLKEISR